MMSLARPARLQALYRHLSTSPAVWSRGGGGPRSARSTATCEGISEEEYTAVDVEVPVVDRLKAMSKQNFDMNRFTAAVRRDQPREEIGPEVPERRARKGWTPAEPADREVPERESRNKLTTLKPGADDSSGSRDRKDAGETPQKKPAAAESWRSQAPISYDAFGLEQPEVPEKKMKRREKEKEESPGRPTDSAPAAPRQKKERKPLGDAKYPYLEDSDPMFKRILTDVRNRSLRAKNHKILLEGHRLINDALENGVRVKTVFFSHPDLIGNLSAEGLRLMKTDLFQVSPKQMKLWSEMTTPPGVMGISEIPDPAVMDSTKHMPLTVVLDNIRDPGNMGAIIRVLAAASCSQIICMKGCVDAWDSKVLRAGMGAHFHVPIQTGLEWAMIGNHLPNPATVYLADNLEERAPGPHIDTEKTRGARMVPRRRAHRLDVVPYHHVDFHEGSVVLIIGGESAGVSWSAYLETTERRGKKLVIPMGNYVDSLNAASVVAVLAFEMRRQRLLLDDDVVPEQEAADADAEADNDTEDAPESERSLGKLP